MLNKIVIEGKVSATYFIIRNTGISNRNGSITYTKYDYHCKYDGKSN